MTALKIMCRITMFECAYNSLLSGVDDTPEFDYGILTGALAAARDFGKLSAEEYNEIDSIIVRLFDKYDLKDGG